MMFARRRQWRFALIAALVVVVIATGALVAA
jgi:hypothetical protein